MCTLYVCIYKRYSINFLRRVYYTCTYTICVRWNIRRKTYLSFVAHRRNNITCNGDDTSSSPPQFLELPETIRKLHRFVSPFSFFYHYILWIFERRKTIYDETSRNSLEFWNFLRLIVVSCGHNVLVFHVLRKQFDLKRFRNSFVPVCMLIWFNSIA